MEFIQIFEMNNHLLNIFSLKKAIRLLDDKMHCKEVKCPSPEKLVLAARLELELKERLRIMDHIDICGSCADEFQTIINIIKKEKEFLDQVKKRQL